MIYHLHVSYFDSKFINLADSTRRAHFIFNIYVLITVTESRPLLSAGGLLVPVGIMFPVVSVSVLTWFIRYICY